MPSQESASIATASFNPELQAARLWTFVHSKQPRFTSKVALDIVRRVSPKPGEDIRALAERLRAAMQDHGVALKHTAALEAAAGVMDFDGWHTANREPIAPRLNLTPISVTGDAADMFLSRAQEFHRWHDLVPQMCRWCDARVAAQSSKVFQVYFALSHVMVGTPGPRIGGRPGELQLKPLFGVYPVSSAETWLDEAPAAFEALRRHLEERGIAVLDGVAVAQLCNADGLRHKNNSAGWPEPLSIYDAPNSELVLLREDHPMDPGSAFEIARGDEMTCWSQLELARMDHNQDPPASEIRLDEEAWRIGSGRYVWELVTLRPQDYAPGLHTLRLGRENVEKLYRRYQLARRIFAGQVRHHEVNKRLAYLDRPDETYRVDVQRMLLVLHKAGRTWESVCGSHPQPRGPSAQLPLGLVMTVATEVAPKDPNQFFARPNLAEMTRVDDDLVLRALLPRVDTIRYSIGAVLPADTKEVIKEAMNNLNDSLRVRKMSATGALSAAEDLPQLVYAHDGEELRAALEEQNLQLYAAVMPHLFVIDDIVDSEHLENISPYAFGNTLFLRVVEAQGSDK